MDHATNRRHFWRATFHSMTRLIGQSGVSPAELIDISLKGALVEVPPQWQGGAGDVCQLKLSLASNAAIVMNMVVAHVDGQHVGLRCESIDLDSITHLRRLVELNSGDPALLDRELSMLVRTP